MIESIDVTSLRLRLQYLVSTAAGNSKLAGRKISIWRWWRFSSRSIWVKCFQFNDDWRVQSLTWYHRLFKTVVISLITNQISNYSITLVIQTVKLYTYRIIILFFFWLLCLEFLINDNNKNIRRLFSVVIFCIYILLYVIYTI